MKYKIIAWAIQLYTALGLVTGTLALRAALSGDMRAAFLWLAVSIILDSTDGPLARRFRSAELLRQFNGRKLDDITDYYNYVIVPAVILLQAGLLPRPAWAWALIPLLSSAYGFCQERAKTDDGFFTGFPSYWNIAALYLFFFRWPLSINLLVVGILGILVFVPIKYIDPFKTKPLGSCTRPLTIAWAISALAIIFSIPDTPHLLVRISSLYLCYYLAASFWTNIHQSGR